MTGKNFIIFKGLRQSYFLFYFRIHGLSQSTFSAKYFLGIRDRKQEHVLVSNVSNVNALSIGYQKMDD